MSSQRRFTDAFTRDAVAQVVDRDDAVSDIAERLGMSTKSL
ncbi:MAG TPA: transposase [Paracoccaceae bacterium]|nr:transposase [Paracoccaceae bacterium]